MLDDDLSAAWYVECTEAAKAHIGITNLAGEHESPGLASLSAFARYSVSTVASN